MLHFPCLNTAFCVSGVTMYKMGFAFKASNTVTFNGITVSQPVQRENMQTQQSLIAFQHALQRDISKIQHNEYAPKSALTGPMHATRPMFVKPIAPTDYTATPFLNTVLYNVLMEHTAFFPKANVFTLVR